LKIDYDVTFFEVTIQTKAAAVLVKCLIQKAHVAYFLTEVRLMALSYLIKHAVLENSQHPKCHIVIDFQSFSCSHTIYHLIPVLIVTLLPHIDTQLRLRMLYTGIILHSITRLAVCHIYTFILGWTQYEGVVVIYVYNHYPVLALTLILPTACSMAHMSRARCHRRRSDSWKRRWNAVLC